MSEPVRPWKETEESDRAAELVRLVSGIAPRQVDVGKGWDSVIERVARPKSSRLLWFAAATAAVLLAWVSVQWPLGSSPRPPVPAPVVAVKAPECAEPLMCVEGTQPAPSPSPAVAVQPVPAPSKPRVAVVQPAPEPVEPPVVEALPEPPENVVVATGALWSLTPEGSFHLERGRVEVQPRAEQHTLTTPDLTLVATNARYAADVTEAGTVVRVFEGDVEAFAGKQVVTLRAGDERTFGQAPSALDVVPPEVSSPACARRSLEQRVACLTTEGRGEGLRAQAALYEAAYLQARAGRPAAAELTLRESLRRFPNGVLHPEVRLALMKALYAQKRLPEVGEVGRELLALCPQDPRAADLESFLRLLDYLESR